MSKKVIPNLFTAVLKVGHDHPVQFPLFLNWLREDETKEWLMTIILETNRAEEEMARHKKFVNSGGRIDRKTGDMKFNPMFFQEEYLGKLVSVVLLEELKPVLAVGPPLKLAGDNSWADSMEASRYSSRVLEPEAIIQYLKETLDLTYGAAEKIYLETKAFEDKDSTSDGIWPTQQKQVGHGFAD